VPLVGLSVLWNTVFFACGFYCCFIIHLRVLQINDEDNKLHNVIDKN